MLHDRAKRFVVGVVLRQAFDAKEASGTAEPLQFVVLDELNKYAPRDSSSPIKEILLDVAERGRSLGMILIGAQQTASEVERRVVANSAVRVVGRLDAAEAGREQYGFLPSVQRQRATILKPGSMFVSQPRGRLRCDRGHGVRRRGPTWPVRPGHRYGRLDPHPPRHLRVPTGGQRRPPSVYNGIHEMMTELELVAARAHDCDLVVFDGPLRGRTDPSGVGYIKTQQVQYLPDDLAPILGRLGDGDRTPLFLVGSRSYRRFSWYLRLPGPRHQPLSGIVRLELPAVGPIVDAVARAERISALLPRFASEPHREPRAPQNLYPIAGLEHHLRHRLGDALLLERSLRLAAG